MLIAHLSDSHMRDAADVRAFERQVEIPAADRAKLWAAAQAAGVRLILCGHVHRARPDWHEGIAIGLQGQSGAGWAGRSIGWYRVAAGDVTMGRRVDGTALSAPSQVSLTFGRRATRAARSETHDSRPRAVRASPEPSTSRRTGTLE